MMNVTSKGRYALRIMIDLAQHREDGFISLKTVSERTELSMKYLEMIVGNLKKAELVQSTRGKEGGYKLVKDPKDYTIGEILRCPPPALPVFPRIQAFRHSCLFPTVHTHPVA